jgi:PRC-barrel domain
MPTVEHIESWHGQDVLDRAGEKAGRLEDVYYDSTAQEPILVSVKHGMLGRQVSLVPAAEAVLGRDYLRVPYSAEQIQHAESGSAADELSSEQVAAVGVLFNLTLPSSGPLYSASLIERRRIEAEKADQRAREMELEAQRRAAELEEARKRAGAAAEDAQAAERERAEAEAASFEASRESPPQP